MEAAQMTEDRRIKSTFLVATLASTVAGTFITAFNLFDKVNEKRKHRQQKKLDKGQNKRLDELERRVDENLAKIDKKVNNQADRIRDDDVRDSLQQGPVVKREFDRHYAAMGEEFAAGDLIAQNQLQSQVITLQSTVIKLLEEAIFTGKPPDMAKLYNASELARIGSVRALRDQAQRMQQSMPINQGLRPDRPRGRPIGLIRRTSSTPSLRSSITSTSTTSSTSSSSSSDTTTPSYRRSRAIDNPNRVSAGYYGAAIGEPPRKTLTYPNPSSHVSGADLDDEEEYQKSGPLFCRYARDLQHDPRMRVDESIFSSRGCPACGATIPSNTANNVTVGGGHLIDKEVVITERITTTQPRRGSLSVTLGGNPMPVTELVKRYEDRTYLLTPKFMVKCHRVGAERPGGKGYACYLCFRNRDKDTLLKTVRGLVGHVRDKHEIIEYEREEDIRRV
ncbi:hypothetical protein V8F20_010726 [Naviculisporaceae sp. PSN 640]